VTEVQCWFCGKGIDRADELALRICASSLWYDILTFQEIYVHSECAAKHMKGSQMSLELEALSGLIEEHTDENPHIVN
jgi:hypothetical protein